MSMTDPIADMLTRIRNGQTLGQARGDRCRPRKMKLAMAKVLKDEGYIDDFDVHADGGKSHADGAPEVLPGPPGHRPPRARQPSRPAHLRRKDELPKVLGGLGVAIVSTSQGVMTDREARAAGHGGEVLCIVS